MNKFKIELLNNKIHIYLSYAFKNKIKTKISKCFEG